jgi:hypothetical protein
MTWEIGNHRWSAVCCWRSSPCRLHASTTRPAAKKDIIANYDGLVNLFNYEGRSTTQHHRSE